MRRRLSIISIILTALTFILSSCYEEKGPVTFSFVQENATAFRGSNGKITITAGGGSGSFEYSVDNGATWHKSNVFDSLTAGYYKVKVRDKKHKKTISDMKMVLLTQPDAVRPEVYVGVADQRNEQLNNPDGWKFVRENADGFYINFIMLDSIYSQNDLNRFADLFTNKNAIIESDNKDSTQAKEQGYIKKLHRAGFTIPYTSLNYGWELSRQENLKTFELKEGQEPRLCFVQQGPWTLGGDITKDNGKYEAPRSNADYRSWIEQSDGISTDGPMGFWFNDQDQMKAGSYSMVNYAHSLGKKALVMVCPYGAGVQGYTPNMFVETAAQCVRDHEDNDADPDIWAVFEYATDIPAVPEQKDGKPFNSTTGMAYYLINHINGIPGTLNLDVTGSKTAEGYLYEINSANSSDWCDYAAVLKANISDLPEGWDIKFMFGKEDVTSLILSGSFRFYKENRLNPNTTKRIDMTITRPASAQNTEFTVDIELSPYFGVKAMDSFKIKL